MRGAVRSPKVPEVWGSIPVMCPENWVVMFRPDPDGGQARTECVRDDVVRGPSAPADTLLLAGALTATSLIFAVGAALGVLRLKMGTFGA